ncbi:MAG: polysaccharide biosynthesis/export family protein [Phycisphaerales bacterium]|nr:MAG: polysaccharide biosynthesis/export family protein [Phycisphaerales bacterium]
MKTRKNRRCGWLGRSLLTLVSAVAAGQMLGCEVDNFFDPSKTGRFEFTATSTPILERIDVIEQEVDYWSQATPVTPEDLIPSDLSYRMTPGDYVTVEIFELYTPGQWTASTRRIDAGGNFRLPELGDVRAAGLTAQEFQDTLERVLSEGFIKDPQVNVVVEEGSGFRYTVYGAVRGPGVFTLRDPDMRLLDVLAISGDVLLPTTEHIYVIRQVPLTEQVVPAWERDLEGEPAVPEVVEEPPVDIEELIEELDSGEGGGAVNPGVLRQDDEPIIDIDELEPVRVADQPPVDVDELAGRDQRPPGGEDSFIFVEERGEWVRVRGDRTMPGEAGAAEGVAAEPESIIERIIEIPYQKLKQGDSSYNIVIRPSDRIYVEMPLQGVIYIDGEIMRPGVYNLPSVGRMTLSRLVAAAGGPGPLAIPERVDLIRIVGENREACVRVNLAAIRNRTEPDFYLKPDDHIIIGTNWWATPIAIMRNGFRATYGFGFLLDRNFGNDVFGAPPISRVTYQ